MKMSATLVMCVCLLLGCTPNKTAKEDIQNLRALVNLQPNNAKAYFKLGLAYLSEKQYEEALAALQRAVDLNPNDTAAQAILGITNFEMKRYKEALPSFQKLTELAPNNHEAFFNLGNVYMNLKQFEQAIPAYRKAIELRKGKDYVEAEYSIGVAYYELGKPDSARIQYEKIKDKNNFMAGSLLRKIEKRN